MLHVAFKGKVFAGTGEGRKFTELPWVKKTIKEKIGFEPYPGTLNLALPAQLRLCDLLGKSRGCEIPARKGYFSGCFYKALIMRSVFGALVRPNVPDYPDDVAELVASVCLRETLNLEDGDELEVEVWLEED
jgi:riboflavin kinase